MDDTPTVSVVIATYNRMDSLARTLESISRQTYPADRVEIVVVDDGSSDGTQAMCADRFGGSVKYVRQSHLGGTAAKNRGAAESTHSLLLFLDDDITIVEPYIACLVEAHRGKTKSIVMGVLHNIPPGCDAVPDMRGSSADCTCTEAHFTECLAGFFSIRRADLVSVGMLEDPAPGFWPNWEDIDLAYRARQQGYRFWQCPAAVGYHWDHVLASLDTQCRRWEHAARSAVLLFDKHPGLRDEIPMFRDKGPIAWRRDPPALILRKIARQMASSRPSMWTMRQLAAALERRAPDSLALRLLSRWIVSGHIYRGYRSALRLNQGGRD
ncbi:MAG: glycosyltransferase family 2 protein [Anaerolineales bacterium]|nr:glycosyltransferase family 2 protein [Anaerolineales bacterium]